MHVKDYAEKMVKVMIKNPEFGTPSTIGLFAPWGSGKSRFVNYISKYVYTYSLTILNSS